MALSLICACGARFEVEDTLAGQDVSCPECQQSLKAPALKQPALRTSDLALASAVFALVGAFTLVGTVIAVILGVLALIRIRRNRDRISGAGFAIFGIVGGTAFTLLFVLALGSGELFGLGGRLRRNMLADRVNTSGELTHKDDSGFSITRPSRDWGVATVDELGDPFVIALQGQPPNQRKTDFLLVATHRVLYADVRSELRPLANIDRIMDEAVAVVTADRKVDPEDLRRTRDNEANLFRIRKVETDNSSKRLDAGEGVEAREREVTVCFATGRPWKMLVRVYCKDSKFYVVRAYGPQKAMKYGADDIRKLFDSFTIEGGP
jgi:hypothetical protein